MEVENPRKSVLHTCRIVFLIKNMQGAQKGLDKFMADHSNSALKPEGLFQEDRIVLPAER